jgi:hypothetical protein
MRRCAKDLFDIFWNSFIQGRKTIDSLIHQPKVVTDATLGKPANAEHFSNASRSR